MPIVPHDEPVAKAVAAASRKTSAGTMPGESVSESRSVSHVAVPSASLTFESDHARIRMMTASSIDRMPAYHASIASSSVRMRCVTDSSTATTTDASDAHIMAVYEFADPTMFWSVISIPSSATAARPVIHSPMRTPATSTPMGSNALMSRFGASAGGSSSSDSAWAASAVEPGRKSCPVWRARRSAASIGPKSRFVSVIVKTKKSASSG